MLGVNDVESFEKARAALEAQGWRGDDLANALLAAQPDNVPFVKRYHDDKLNDGPDGEPAMITDVSGAGAGYKVEHYAHGYLQDPADGSPAVTICEKGPGYEKSAAVARHYRDNKPQDGAKGEPSCQAFDAKGKLVSAFRTTEKNAGIPLGRFKRKRVQAKHNLTAPTKP